MNCILCGGEYLSLVTEELRDTKYHKVYECDQCGHTQLWPRPTKQEAKEFYDKNGQDRLSGVDMSKDRLFVDTNRRVEFFRCNFPRSVNILDIGTGYGHFIKAMYNIGYTNVTGQDISTERSQPGTITKDIFDIGVNELPKIDVVTMFHVIEHLPDPVSFLTEVRKFLKPKGIIIVETPNVKERLMEICQPYNKYNHIKSHLSYYSINSLERNIFMAGYKDIHCRPIQRYSIENARNWLDTGKPQLDNPSFTCPPKYKILDDMWRNKLVEEWATDTLWAWGRN